MGKNKRPKRTIAIDFDGVLHQYDGYKNGLIREPIAGAKEGVEALLQQGHKVVVFSTRDAFMINEWLAKYEFPDLEVTNIKKPFYVIVDDRAVRFDGVWSNGFVESVASFEPYWILARESCESN